MCFDNIISRRQLLGRLLFRKGKICLLFIFTFLQLQNTCLFAENYSNSKKPENKNTIDRDSLKKSIYMEFLGCGYYLTSVNFESVMFSHSSFSLTGRVGLSAGPTFSKPFLVISIPVLINGQFKINKAISYEIGAGYLFVADYVFVNTGFRILAKNGFLLKINFTPQYRFNNSQLFFYGHRLDYTPWFGISIGKSFGKGQLFKKIGDFQRDYYENKNK